MYAARGLQMTENRYIILRLSNADLLQERVNGLMMEGWVPLGGPFVFKNVWIVPPSDWWAQAMVRNYVCKY